MALSRIEHEELANAIVDRLVSEGFHAGPLINDVRILRNSLVEVKIKVLRNLGEAGLSRKQEESKDIQPNNVCGILEKTCANCVKTDRLKGRCTPYPGLIKDIKEELLKAVNRRDLLPIL